MSRTSPRKKPQASVDFKAPAARKGAATSRAAGAKRKVKHEEDEEAEVEACDSCGEGENEDEDVADQKPVKRRKTTAAPKASKASKASKADDMAPLAARTVVSTLKRTMYIGAHVSGAGGVQNSVTNATHIGANAFALFLKSQRKWESPPLASDAKDQFLALTKQHSYDAAAHVLPHGSYLVNLAQADDAKAKQAYSSFVDDLKRCEQLGIRLYNFHPGNTGGAPRAEACRRIAAQINRAHAETSTVITVLENMAGAGNVVGTLFSDLRDIIAAVDDKTRVGVCLDTCHAFAAGYDLRTPEAFEATVADFDATVGLSYLKAFHFNDSKAPFASHRDLHANIGTGFLGLRAFHSIVNHEPFQGLPMVLETPIDRKDAKGKAVEDKQVWADEIKLLESLIGMDAESKEFKDLEVELQSRGAEDRKKTQQQADDKAAKEAKKAARESKKGAAGAKKGGRAATKKKKQDTDDEGDSE